jgi:hypothetical protein
MYARFPGIAIFNMDVLPAARLVCARGSGGCIVIVFIRFFRYDVYRLAEHDTHPKYNSPFSVRYTCMSSETQRAE